MSTKNLREVLAWAKNNQPGRLDGVVADARAELEAIEKACMTLYQTGVVHNERGEEHETTPALDEAADYLMRIGMEQGP